MVLGNGFYLVNLDSEADKTRILSSGPYFPFSRYLHVEKRRPNFRADKAKITTAVVWVRFPYLPPELMNAKYLFRVAKRIGKPIKLDSATAGAERLRYARFCVEIDLTKPFLPAFKTAIGTEAFPIVYEGLRTIC